MIFCVWMVHDIAEAQQNGKIGHAMPFRSQGLHMALLTIEGKAGAASFQTEHHQNQAAVHPGGREAASPAAEKPGREPHHHAWFPA